MSRRKGAKYNVPSRYLPKLKVDVCVCVPGPVPQVWKKGVDSDTFHPRFRSEAMRLRLTNGRPERPVMVYVGRLGFEKNLFFLREVLARNPDVSLAFVGDGPARVELQAAFKGTATVFLGMMHVSRLGSMVC